MTKKDFSRIKHERRELKYLNNELAQHVIKREHLEKFLHGQQVINEYLKSKDVSSYEPRDLEAEYLKQIALLQQHNTDRNTYLQDLILQNAQFRNQLSEDKAKLDHLQESHDRQKEEYLTQKGKLKIQRDILLNKQKEKEDLENKLKFEQTVKRLELENISNGIPPQLLKEIYVKAERQELDQEMLRQFRIDYEELLLRQKQGDFTALQNQINNLENKLNILDEALQQKNQEKDQLKTDILQIKTVDIIELENDWEELYKGSEVNSKNYRDKMADLEQRLNVLRLERIASEKDQEKSYHELELLVAEIAKLQLEICAYEAMLDIGARSLKPEIQNKNN